MKLLASSASQTQALAMSAGVLMRPSGMVAMNFARFSGVSASPMNSVSRPVAPITGQTELTRMFSGASSAAMHCDHDVHRRLAAVVPDEAGARADAGGRTDIDDRAAALLPPQHRQRGAPSSRSILHSHVHPIEIGLGHVGERLVPVRRAGVVDDDVEAAEFFHGGVDERLDIGL